MNPRAAVVEEARAWLGTPYRHMARVKGKEGGCDCLTLVAEVYERAGIVGHIEIPFYPPDWHLHRGAERYLDGLLAHAREVGEPQPGDIALFRFGRCFAHGGIVTQWPRLIHAWNGAGVVPVDADQPLLGPRPRRFFDPFQWPAQACPGAGRGRCTAPAGKPAPAEAGGRIE